MKDTTKILERIKKLLNLAGNNPNESEAASAMEKVQALLAEHNLSMSDVKTHDKAEDGFVIDSTLETDSRPWRRQLATMVGELYFCTYFFAYRKQMTKARKCGYIRYDVHNFVGARHNVAVVHLMFQYLNDAVDRLARDGATRLSVKERTPYVNSFRHACANRLCHRIQKRIDDASKGMVKKADGSNLPALASLYDSTALQLQSFLDEKMGDQLHVPGDRSKSTSFFGKIEGDAAGERVSLEHQVSTSSVGHLLGAPDKSKRGT